MLGTLSWRVNRSQVVLDLNLKLQIAGHKRICRIAKSCTIAEIAVQVHFELLTIVVFYLRSTNAQFSRML